MSNILELKKGIYVEKITVTEKLIKSISNYMKNVQFLTEYELKNLEEKNSSIYLIYDTNNNDKKIIGHAIIHPIENSELILVYDFKELDFYPLGDDSDIHGTFLKVLEIAPDYRGIGIGEDFVTYVKETTHDRIILKSVNGSMEFWERQGFEFIYSSYYEDLHWFFLNNN